MPMLRVICAALLCLLCSGVAGAETGPQAGEIFPEEALQAPKSPRERDYLGLSQDVEQFRIRDVKAPVVVVEIFSMYCPYCQREAPEVNGLYERIHEEGLEDSIVMLGIGPGNSAYEVGIFQEKFKVPFPLFPDRDYDWHKVVGEVGTPYFFVLERDGEAMRIRISHLGPFESPEAFLERIRSKTGL